MEKRILLRVLAIVNEFTKEEARKDMGQNEVIPSKVVEVTSCRAQVRAVVIVEHRNLAIAMEWFEMDLTTSWW